MFVYAANCAVKGLSFQRFPWVGMALLYSDAHNNSIRGCWFGLDYSGAAAAPNHYQGIQISNGANSNTIGGASATDRNVLSGNTQYGIWISDANTTGNVVLGNYIGTSADGLAALPNGLGGLIVTDSSHDNTIGGTSAGARNVISGNRDAGVWLIGAGVNQNTVRGNYIGLDENGSAAVPNTMWGVYIRDRRPEQPRRGQRDFRQHRGGASDRECGDIGQCGAGKSCGHRSRREQRDRERVCRGHDV